MPAKKIAKIEKKAPTKKAEAKKAPAKKAPAAKAPAAAKAVSKKTGTKRTVTKKAAKKSPTRKKTVISAEERFCQIQEAAYYIAEKSGFARDATECWVEAEALITRLHKA